MINVDKEGEKISSDKEKEKISIDKEGEKLMLIDKKNYQILTTLMFMFW